MDATTSRPASNRERAGIGFDPPVRSLPTGIEVSETAPLDEIIGGTFSVRADALVFAAAPYPDEEIVICGAARRDGIAAIQTGLGTSMLGWVGTGPEEGPP